MTAVAKKKPVRFSIESARGATRQDLVAANARLVSVLGKREFAEIDCFSIPDDKDDLYRRRTLVFRVPKTSPHYHESDDQPDLDDLNYTNLPWMGDVSFTGLGSRPFRSKYGLTACVEVVRELDGYLYTISCESNPERSKRPIAPVLVSLKSPSRLQTAYQITIDDVEDTEQLLKYFDKAPLVPPTLVKELTGFGFVQHGSTFVIEEGDHAGTRLNVRLYGKITIPL